MKVFVEARDVEPECYNKIDQVSIKKYKGTLQIHFKVILTSTGKITEKWIPLARFAPNIVNYSTLHDAVTVTHKKEYAFQLLFNQGHKAKTVDKTEYDDQFVLR